MLATSALTSVAPALATSGGDEQGGVVDPNAHPGAVRSQITFVKKPAHPWNSRITWLAEKQQVDGSWKTVAKDSWARYRPLSYTVANVMPRRRRIRPIWLRMPTPKNCWCRCPTTIVNC